MFANKREPSLKNLPPKEKSEWILDNMCVVYIHKKGISTPEEALRDKEVCSFLTMAYSFLCDKADRKRIIKAMKGKDDPDFRAKVTEEVRKLAIEAIRRHKIAYKVVYENKTEEVAITETEEEMKDVK